MGGEGGGGHLTDTKVELDPSKRHLAQTISKLCAKSEFVGRLHDQITVTFGNFGHIEWTYLHFPFPSRKQGRVVPLITPIKDILFAVLYIVFSEQSFECRISLILIYIDPFFDFLVLFHNNQSFQIVLFTSIIWSIAKKHSTLAKSAFSISWLLSQSSLQVARSECVHWFHPAYYIGSESQLERNNGSRINSKHISKQMVAYSDCQKLLSALLFAM